MGSPTEDQLLSSAWAVSQQIISLGLFVFLLWVKVAQRCWGQVACAFAAIQSWTVSQSCSSQPISQDPPLFSKPPKISHLASCAPSCAVSCVRSWSKLCPFPGPVWSGPFSAASFVGRCSDRGFQADEGLRRLFRAGAVNRGSCQGPAWCVETVPKCHIPGGCGALDRRCGKVDGNQPRYMVI